MIETYTQKGVSICPAHAALRDALDESVEVLHIKKGRIITKVPCSY